MKISILSRYSASVLFEFEHENNSIKLTLQTALKAKTDLSRANLSRANLSRADLSRANLRGADLSGADLSGANLSRADLSRANLSRADLSRANLSRADLSRANLSGADLRRADLSRANIDGETISKAPIQLNNLHWPVLITDTYLRIGCQRHLISEWRLFDDARIAKMESRALAFWAQWKVAISALCDAHNGVEGE